MKEIFLINLLLFTLSEERPQVLNINALALGSMGLSVLDPDCEPAILMLESLEQERLFLDNRDTLLPVLRVLLLYKALEIRSLKGPSLILQEVFADQNEILELDSSLLVSFNSVEFSAVINKSVHFFHHHLLVITSQPYDAAQDLADLKHHLFVIIQLPVIILDSDFFVDFLLSIFKLLLIIIFQTFHVSLFNVLTKKESFGHIINGCLQFEHNAFLILQVVWHLAIESFIIH